MKIPRDVSSGQLIKMMKKLGYKETRQVGSHVRLTIVQGENTYHITIPKHTPIKIGTLNNILKNASMQLNISKQDLIEKL